MTPSVSLPGCLFETLIWSPAVWVNWCHSVSAWMNLLPGIPSLNSDSICNHYSPSQLYYSTHVCQCLLSQMCSCACYNANGFHFKCLTVCCRASCDIVLADCWTRQHIWQAVAAQTSAISTPSHEQLQIGHISNACRQSLCIHGTRRCLSGHTATQFQLSTGQSDTGSPSGIFPWRAEFCTAEELTIQRSY